MPKTLLVLPPLPAAAIRTRWELFRMMATSYEVPSELVQTAHHHLVLAPTDRGRWTVWHSRWRAEWDYAVALRKGASNILDPNRPAR